MHDPGPQLHRRHAEVVEDAVDLVDAGQFQHLVEFSVICVEESDRGAAGRQPPAGDLKSLVVTIDCDQGPRVSHVFEECGGSAAGSNGAVDNDVARSGLDGSYSLGHHDGPMVGTCFVSARS